MGFQNTTLHNYVQENNGQVPKWPYPIRYGEVKVVESDVLVIGGGVAGCHAAINAANSGAKVVIAEKGCTKRSGQGGEGVDHWIAACTNPCSQVRPEEFAQEWFEQTGKWNGAMVAYIAARDSWDTLLNCERYGVQIRDVKDEFEGSAFRDEESKLTFAYDYINRHHLRVWGNNMKPCLYAEVMRLGVDVHDRVMITSLLNEGGRVGDRVVGATGLNVRTGEFLLFKSKATIVCSNSPGRNWMFNLEQTGAGDILEINNSGDGTSAGWKAGAEVAGLERTWAADSGTGYVPYGTGNAHNSWFGTSIVDANGKEVPWIDMAGRKLESMEARFVPGEGNPFSFGQGFGIEDLTKPRSSDITPDLPERISSGEFTLPLYADLTRLSEKERRAIFGTMVGNEGKTRVGVYETLTQAGFDPAKHMLQVPILPVESYGFACYWTGAAIPEVHRASVGGGFVVDWSLRTSVEGLYAGGQSLFGHCLSHAAAAATGRYVGGTAAKYAHNASQGNPCPESIETEKDRVYAPLNQARNHVNWKELNVAITRVMLDHCGVTMTEASLQHGIRVLRDMRETEAKSVFASNPHELGRALECTSILECSEIIAEASLARQASNESLMFQRIDYPDDSPEWRKWQPLKRTANGEVSRRDLPLDYHAQGPYSSDFEENYQANCGANT